MDAQYGSTLASADLDFIVEHPRDSRAAATVKSERNNALARRLHSIAMGSAIVAMGILAGAALGIAVAPAPARAAGHRAASSHTTTTSTVASTLTPAHHEIHAKAAAPVAPTKGTHAKKTSRR